MDQMSCPNCGKQNSEHAVLCSECNYPLILEFFENLAAKVEKISFALNINMILGGLLLVLGSTVVPVYCYGIEDVKTLGLLMMMVTFPGAIFFVLGICLFFVKFLLKLWRNKVKPKLLTRLGFHTIFNR